MLVTDEEAKRIGGGTMSKTIFVYCPFNINDQAFENAAKEVQRYGWKRPVRPHVIGYDNGRVAYMVPDEEFRKTATPKLEF